MSNAAAIWTHVATHRAVATGATFTHCGVTAPVHQLVELPREGERAAMLYNLVELPNGALVHPVEYPERRRALELDAEIVGWVE